VTGPLTPTRLATLADLPALAGALTRAFADDPVALWSCPSERLRPRVLTRFYETRLRQVLETGEVWVDESLGAAAMWLPPGAWRTTSREDLAIARSLTHPTLLPRLPLVAYGLLGVERRHPRTPHWYLAVLGTDPGAQGRGLGTAVLREVLERCDADGIGAYLESSKERNVDYYARFGFRVTDEHDLPRGPRLWPMWRDPR
jgi:ribosomal protein S18 acetylase RimI-like enzyme